LIEMSLGIATTSYEISHAITFWDYTQRCLALPHTSTGSCGKCSIPAIAVIGLGSIGPALLMICAAKLTHCMFHQLPPTAINFLDLPRSS
jgi:hypothetical protein